jgi:hypothetical protein
MVDFDWLQDRFGRRDRERVINGLRGCVAKAIASQSGQVILAPRCDVGVQHFQLDRYRMER